MLGIPSVCPGKVCVLLPLASHVLPPRTPPLTPALFCGGQYDSLLTECGAPPLTRRPQPSVSPGVGVCAAPPAGPGLSRLSATCRHLIHLAVSACLRAANRALSPARCVVPWAPRGSLSRVSARRLVICPAACLPGSSHSHASRCGAVLPLQRMVGMERRKEAYVSVAV